jgi:hypothetical protein
LNWPSEPAASLVPFQLSLPNSAIFQIFART